MNDKREKSKSFIDSAVNKIGNFGSQLGNFVENPEMVLQRIWKKYEKWIFAIGLYIGLFFIFRWMGKTNGLAWGISLIMLLASPFFFLWIVTRFIPEIKVGDKTIFSREKLNLEKQLRYGLRGMWIVAKEIYRAYPNFSLLILFGFLILLVIIV